MASPKILVFAGSIRTGALSGKLAALAAKELALADADVTRISLADYPLPIYNGDLEKEKGIPENAVKLARLIAAQQGVFIATPEYNNSLPPLLKNTIDWVSRNKCRAERHPLPQQGLRHRLDLRRADRRRPRADRPPPRGADRGRRDPHPGEDRDQPGAGRLRRIRRAHRRGAGKSSSRSAATSSTCRGRLAD